MLEFSLALLLILDLLFTLLFGLFVRLILLLLCPAWFCFIDNPELNGDDRIVVPASDVLLPDKDAALYPLRYASL
jgi:hypothetical protein